MAHCVWAVCIGVTEYGTPLLNLLSAIQQRYVLSADTDFDAIDRFNAQFGALNHEYTDVQVPLLSTADTAVVTAPTNQTAAAPFTYHVVGALEKWSVAVITSDPSTERITHMRRLLPTTEVIVVSGAQAPENGLLDALRGTEATSADSAHTPPINTDWKYAVGYDNWKEMSVVVSNVLDVTGWFQAVSKHVVANTTHFCAPINPCNNFGLCVEYVHSFGCVCAFGWEGR